MAFVESTAPFFADFGVSVTLGGAAVRGIFDDAYGEAFGGLVAGSGPMFRLPSSGVPYISPLGGAMTYLVIGQDGQSVAVTRGDSLVLGATTYTVVGIEPDGTGITTLRLEKA